jgi:hypothetical protein
VTVEEILADHQRVDLIDFDIQGAEGEVIPSSIAC